MGAGSRFHADMARSVNPGFTPYGCRADGLPQSKLTLGRDNVAVALTSPL
ncbi:hypothetical protein [Streptomyces sp. NPDC048639]